MTSIELIEFRKILKRRKPKFLRKDTFKKSKLGKRRKKKQKWRRPRGRHSKLREKRVGYMIQPSIGWSSPKAVRGFMKGARPKLIFNVKDLQNLKEDEIAILGKVGKKKKIEIAKEAITKNICIGNLNTKKFLEMIEREKEMRKIKKSQEEKKETQKIEKPEEKKTSKEIEK